MACPMGYGVRFGLHSNNSDDGSGAVPEKGTGEVQGASSTPNKAAFSGHLNYGDYLQLDRLLSCQTLKSAESNQLVPDEHLFIIIHQTYELWFKQIIFDLDNVRRLLHNRVVDETKTLQIVQLLERTVRILKLLVDQMLILETMSPLDFVEFRKYLTSASGFQSLQFRLLENKLGVIGENRVRYNSQHYVEAFTDGKERKCLMTTEHEPSLFVLIDRWLSRTPGIYEIDEWGSEEADCCRRNGDRVRSCSSADEEHSPTSTKRNSFWNRYLEAVDSYLHDMKSLSEDEGISEEERCLKRAEYVKVVKSFESITVEHEYQALVEKGERRLSHNALKGALMIYFYRDMPRFHCAYMILTFLMDIDSLLQKWRYNHVMLVQRMLGNKQGSGGSSGYLYLRTTVSDRYKVFLDLFNLSTWLIPRAYIPPLSAKMVKTLSEHSNLSNNNNNNPNPMSLNGDEDVGEDCGGSGGH